MRRNVMDLIKKISHQRGGKNESAVKTALDEMKDNGEIVNFYKTGRRADKFQGIDFFIIKISGDKVPLQVKSSFAGALEHQKKFPNIPVVVVNVENAETIKNEIRGVLE